LSVPEAAALTPLADAFVRDGSYGDTNYGSHTALIVKDGTYSGYTRAAYFKFDVSQISSVTSAKLRVYCHNAQDQSVVNSAVFGTTTDSWTESGLTWNNAPAATASVLSTVSLDQTAQYRDLDVTSFVKSELADGTVTLMVTGSNDQDRTIQLNSKENVSYPPLLIIEP
jgi:hypothetical protein